MSISQVKRKINYIPVLPDNNDKKRNKTENPGFLQDLSRCLVM
jgi:hypothetical protein